MPCYGLFFFFQVQSVKFEVGDAFFRGSGAFFLRMITVVSDKTRTDDALRAKLRAVFFSRVQYMLRALSGRRSLSSIVGTVEVEAGWIYKERNAKCTGETTL